MLSEAKHLTGRYNEAGQCAHPWPDASLSLSMTTLITVDC